MKRLHAFLAFVTSLTIVLGGIQITHAADSKDGLVVEDTAYPFPSYEQAVQTTDVEKYTHREGRKVLRLSAIASSSYEN